MTDGDEGDLFLTLGTSRVFMEGFDPHIQEIFRNLSGVLMETEGKNVLKNIRRGFNSFVL